MPNLGAKIAFMALHEGTPVYDVQDKRIGVIEDVLADEQAAIFEGILIHTLPLPGRHVVADVDQISALHEQGVLLSVDRPSLRSAKNAKRTPFDSERELERPLQAGLRRRGIASPGRALTDGVCGVGDRPPNGLPFGRRVVPFESR
jgi:hypothetical protein